MITKEYKVSAKANCEHVINLGHRGDGKENESGPMTRIVFDCSDLASDYGDGACEVLHVRAGDDDNEMYPVLVSQVDNIVTWDVSTSDTSRAGQGILELRWYVGQSVIKAHYRTLVSNALNADTEAPQPYKAWVDEVLEHALTIDEAKAVVESYTDEAERLALDAKTSAESSEESKVQAKASADSARASAESSEESKVQAKASEDSARASAESSEESKLQAKASADNASVSADKAKVSEDNAKDSEAKAKASEVNTVKAKEDAEQASAIAASKASQASNSESNAQTYASYAHADASDALEYANQAKGYRDDAKNVLDEVEETYEDMVADVANLRSDVANVRNTTYTKTEVDKKISDTRTEIDQTRSNTYTKNESDERYQPRGNYLTQHQDISGKADKANTYTMAQVDQKVEQATPSDYDAVKGRVTSVEGEVAKKADKATTYTKTEVDAKIADATPKDYDDVKSRVTAVEEDLNDTKSKLSSQIVDIDERVEKLEDEPKVPQSLIDDVANVKTGLSQLSDRVDTITDNIAVSMLNGTVAGYHKAMHDWVLLNTPESPTPQEITDAVDEWYKLTRTGWNGGVVFKQPDISTSSEGEKVGDNVGMICIPSTSLEANRDDYASNPLFAVSTVNWILDENGEPLVTAIKGIHSSFEQNNPDKYVGVMQMTGYVKWFEDEQTYAHMYSDTPLEGYIPLPEARRLDGTTRNFMIHGKYMSSTVGGKMTCCSGLIPTAFNSHNSLIDLSKKNGPMYSAGCIVDWSFLVWMTMIKYGSMTQDARIQGCVSYSFQYYAKVTEGTTNRILLSTSEASDVAVGSSVIVGEYAGNADRGQAAIGSMTPNGAIVIAVENVTINGATYGAVYLDTDITTVANGNAVDGSTIISSWHWKSGTNDDVLGNDGSHLTPTNGRYPAMIQGIEFAVGGYDVFEDVILNINNGVYEVYTARTKALHKTSVQTGMVLSELTSAQPTSNSWDYIRRLKYDGEIFFGTDTTGGSSSTFTRDGFYKNGSGTKTGTREWLAFGGLDFGSGGGLSFLGALGALGSSDWVCLARLSANCNRGEVS